jgi:molybdopterin converting factor small subunit
VSELASSPDGAAVTVVRVKLPTHLRRLAQVDGEIALDVDGPMTVGAVLDALEARHPVLRGAIRDRATGRRRAFVRFFACEEDLSHDGPDAALPEPVVRGAEPLLVVGAMAGG